MEDVGDIMKSLQKNKLHEQLHANSSLIELIRVVVRKK